MNLIGLLFYDSLNEKTNCQNTSCFSFSFLPLSFDMQYWNGNNIRNTWMIKKNSKFYFGLLAYIFPPKFNTYPHRATPVDFQLFSVHSITQEIAFFRNLQKNFFRCNLHDLCIMNHLLLECSLNYFRIYK